MPSPSLLAPSILAVSLLACAAPELAPGTAAPPSIPSTPEATPPRPDAACPPDPPDKYEEMRAAMRREEAVMTSCGLQANR